MVWRKLTLLVDREREIQVNIDDKNYKVTDFLLAKCNKQFYFKLRFPTGSLKPDLINLPLDYLVNINL